MQGDVISLNDRLPAASLLDKAAATPRALRRCGYQVGSKRTTSS